MSNIPETYDIYHDESQENGYWHGILLVPRSTRSQILNYLKLIREKADYQHYITFKNLRRKGDLFQCLRMCIELGAYTLIQDLKKGGHLRIYYGERTGSSLKNCQSTNYSELIKISSPVKAKFILFKEKDCHKQMDSSFYPDHTAKVETTFRMGLKGGLHLLFNNENPAYIKSIHFDGHEHHKRHIDKNRIVGRLREGLRGYCKFDNDPIIDDKTSNHKKPKCQDYNDCQLLQLTDLLVGAFRTSLGDAKNKIQGEASESVKELINKWKRGIKGMRNSRWNKGFCISECYIENNSWRFDSLIKSNAAVNQQSMLQGF